MNNKTTPIDKLIKKRGKLLDGLRTGRPLIESSLSEIHTRCGKTNCRCATGKKHISYLLTRSEKGKTKTTYVPMGLLPEVKEWVREYRFHKERLKKITMVGEEIARRYVKEKHMETGKRTKPKL